VKRGIWAGNDTNGNETLKEPNDFFVPILQHSAGSDSPVLMLNLRYEQTRRNAIDSLINCVNNSTTSTATTCSEITDRVTIETMTKLDDSPPGALLLEPIQLMNSSNNNELVGVVVSTIVWHELFDNVFSDRVSGIQCVLEVGDHQSYTFDIEKGVATLSQISARDGKYERLKTSVVLTEPKVFDVEHSPQYYLSIYPT